MDFLPVGACFIVLLLCIIEIASYAQGGTTNGENGEAIGEEL